MLIIIVPFCAIYLLKYLSIKQRSKLFCSLSSTATKHRPRMERATVLVFPIEVNKNPPKWAETCFKVVALDPDERALLSVFDATTRYRLGATLWQPARPNHQGGLYCFK